MGILMINLICKNNTGYEEFLTIGKHYKAEVRVQNLQGIFYIGIHNDRLGNKDRLPSTLFTTLEEWRQMRINEIIQ
jgi:hypothetical protein